MKKYVKPNITLAQMNIENFITASNDPNQIINGGGGINTGGYSSESTDQGNNNGSVDDMAKKHDAWILWDD